MNNDTNKFTDDEKRFMEEKSCIESLLKDPNLFHATLCVKRKHFPVFQKMFPNHLKPMFPSLEEIETLKSIKLSQLQKQLQKDFPNSKIVLTVPSLEKVQGHSLEEYFSDEISTEEECIFLRNAQKSLQDMQSELCDSNEIMVSFWP